LSKTVRLQRAKPSSRREQREQSGIQADAMSNAFESQLRSLRDLLQHRSIKKKAPGEPDFALASGGHSGYYCNVKAAALSPEGSFLIGETIFRLADDEGAEAIGGLQLGATFIAMAVALISGRQARPIYGFTVRDQQKAHGTKEKIAASFHPDGRELLCPGRRVVVVEDVVTGGHSVLKAVKEVRERQCEILAVIALVDRGAEGGTLLRAEGFRYYALFHATEPGELTINAAIFKRTQSEVSG
jgi:orotate phosphoribosyltransferase